MDFVRIVRQGYNRLSHAVFRVFRNWNVENRARRAISQEDRPAAPRYPTEAKMIAKMSHENPVARKDVPGLEVQKDPALDDWLRKVKVYSRDIPLSPDGPVEQDPRKSAPGAAALPQERHPPDLDEYGYSLLQDDKPSEPRVSPGRLSMKYALELLALSQQDSSLNTPSALASKYNLSENDTRELIKYFGVFQLFMPEHGKTEAQYVDMKKIITTAKGTQAQVFDKYEKSGMTAFERGPAAFAVYEQEKKDFEAEEKRFAERKASGLAEDPKDQGNVDFPEGMKAEKPEDRLKRLDRKRIART